MKTKRGKERQRVPAKEVQCTFCDKILSIQGLQLHLRIKHPEQAKTTMALHEKIRRSHWEYLSYNRSEINAIDMEKLKQFEKEFGVYDQEKPLTGKKQCEDAIEVLTAQLLSEKDASKKRVMEEAIEMLEDHIKTE